MAITRWAFHIEQPLMLDNIASLVTSLTASEHTIVPVVNLLSFLPKDEGDRLLNFRHENDMKRALVGRLLIRAFFCKVHSIPWDQLVLARSPNNKPIVREPEHLRHISFNISHHGDWVVFVGQNQVDSSIKLGVDVMDFQEQVPGESLESFLLGFQDQFTTREMEFMTRPPSPRDESSDAPLSPVSAFSSLASSQASSSSSLVPPNGVSSTGGATRDQLKRFYRLWCLKESLVKAIGIGLDMNLKSIEFTCPNATVGLEPILSTTLEVKESTPEVHDDDQWIFEEALLDSEHGYAVAVQVPSVSPVLPQGALLDGSKMHPIDWDELLKDAVPFPTGFAA